jgi:hypothetical protein
MDTNNDDKPYTLPSAIKLAQLCETRAWDDDVDDDSRLLLEQAGDMIRGLMMRVVRMAAANERAEAERAAR